MTTQPARHARHSGDTDLADAILTALGHLIIGVLAAALVTAWWALLFPMISAPIALAVAAAILLGWPAGCAVAVAGIALLVAWKLLWPNSFKRFVTTRARTRFLRWFRYRRRWARLMIACKLAEGDAGALYLPRVRRIDIGEHIDRVQVRMLPGQSPEDYHLRAVRLAHAFGALECRPIDVGPAVVELVFRHRDSLAAPIPLPIDRTALGWKDVA
ncbi:hypothetical protein ACFYUD_07070 [Nocardia tengchongensis]|uniref:hypothetical protein n=1 Tax=Nocardia tengchongensis TaxID=2055889 RepID=UPI00369F87AE